MGMNKDNIKAKAKVEVIFELASFKVLGYLDKEDTSNYYSITGVSFDKSLYYKISLFDWYRQGGINSLLVANIIKYLKLDKELVYEVLKEMANDRPTTGQNTINNYKNGESNRNSNPGKEVRGSTYGNSRPEGQSGSGLSGTRGKITGRSRYIG